MAISYRSPLLSFPDAVASGDADAPDAGVAWHYGDPVGEQRAAVRGTAMIDLSHRGVIAVSGPDRLTWLNTLTSQLLTDLPAGGVTQALVLSPNGHVEHHMGVTELDGITYLDTEPATTEALLKYLQMMVFWSKVEVAKVELAQLSVLGPTTADVLSAAGLPGGDLTVGSAVALAAGGFARRVDDRVDLFLPHPTLADVAATLMAAGARPAGSWAAEALRIPARVPRLGVDTDDRTIPNEVSWLVSAVHLNKGCYRGQETVARVNNLGRPPRKLVLLHLDGSADRLPETGSAVTTADGRVVGRVGTVAHHHEDGPIALAMIKRSLPPGTLLLADGVDAAVDPDDLVDEAPAGPPPVGGGSPDLHRYPAPLMQLVSLDEITDAAARIAGVAVRTPLLASPWPGLWLKPEGLQPIGAFKIRGAMTAMSRLDPAVRARGVIAHSSGNHAQAVAYAAKVFGVDAHIVIPENAPARKVEATRALGATVELVPVERRFSRPAELVAETGKAMIAPFDDRNVISGQGTIGLEIAADFDGPLTTVLVPVSGGGLISGVAAALAALRPDVKVIGVEPELAGDAADSFRTGRRQAWAPADTARTIADGLRTFSVGELPWEHIRSQVHDIITVTEDEIIDATRCLAFEARLVAEPSGAVPVAAWLHHRAQLPGGDAVAVVSGANIDPDVFRMVLGA